MATLDDFQGTWVPLPGQRQTAILVIEGDQFSVWFAEHEYLVTKGTVRLAPDGVDGHVDFVCMLDDVLTAIYCLDGDELTTCSTLRGPRPTQFIDEGYTSLTRYRRTRDILVRSKIHGMASPQSSLTNIAAEKL